MKHSSFPVCLRSLVRALFITLSAGGLCLTVDGEEPGAPIRPPMSIRDTVEFRTVREIKMAPAGDAIAYVLRRPNLETMRNDDSLAVVAVQTGASRVLHVTEDLKQVTWDRTGKVLYGLSKAGELSRLIQVDVATGATKSLVETKDMLERFGVSRDGALCILASATRSDFARMKSESGLVYEWGRDTFYGILGEGPARYGTTRFTAIRTQGGSPRVIAEIPFDAANESGYVQAVAISPDNRLAGVSLYRAPDVNRGIPNRNLDLRILEVATGKWREVLGELPTQEIGALWLGDSDRIFFTRDGVGTIFHVGTQEVAALPWAKDLPGFLGSSYDYDASTETIIISDATGNLTKLSLRDRQMSGNRTSNSLVSFSGDYSRYAFLSETTELPPEIALATTSGGEQRRLTKLNPQLDGMSLAKVEKLDITNGFGRKASAYLVYPIGYESGRRYPLLLISYGFRGKFLTVAEWHSTFPVQTLAGQGYATLMINLSSRGEHGSANPAEARQREGWNHLSTFEAAVQMLVDREIADPTKLGLYGWSHGASIVEFLVTHSKLNFTAACYGEGGGYGPALGWAPGHSSGVALLNTYYGGLLNAQTAAAYLEYSPALNVEKIKTPMLMEFKSLWLMTRAGELYIPLRVLKTPAELVGYDNEVHNFVRPGTRFASMHRKVDWFNYWMLGKEDPDPAKADQYTRWRKMKVDWERQQAWEAAVHPAGSIPAKDFKVPEKPPGSAKEEPKPESTGTSKN